jgi:hypothetical protein
MPREVKQIHDFSPAMSTPILTISPEGVARLLNPRSVAIVGASAKPGALGAAVLRNLDRNGFGGTTSFLESPA